MLPSLIRLSSSWVFFLTGITECFTAFDLKSLSNNPYFFFPYEATPYVIVFIDLRDLDSSSFLLCSSVIMIMD